MALAGEGRLVVGQPHLAHAAPHLVQGRAQGVGARAGGEDAVDEGELVVPRLRDGQCLTPSLVATGDDVVQAVDPARIHHLAHGAVPPVAGGAGGVLPRPGAHGVVEQPEGGGAGLLRVHVQVDGVGDDLGDQPHAVPHLKVHRPPPAADGGNLPDALGGEDLPGGPVLSVAREAYLPHAAALVAGSDVQGDQCLGGAGDATAEGEIHRGRGVVVAQGEDGGPALGRVVHVVHAAQPQVAGAGLMGAAQGSGCLVLGIGDELGGGAVGVGAPEDVVALDAGALVVGHRPGEVRDVGGALPHPVGDAGRVAGFLGVLRRRAVVAEGEEGDPVAPVAGVVHALGAQVVGAGAHAGRVRRPGAGVGRGKASVHGDAVGIGAEIKSVFGHAGGGVGGGLPGEGGGVDGLLPLAADHAVGFGGAGGWGRRRGVHPEGDAAGGLLVAHAVHRVVLHRVSAVAAHGEGDAGAVVGLPGAVVHAIADLPHMGQGAAGAVVGGPEAHLDGGVEPVAVAATLQFDPGLRRDQVDAQVQAAAADGVAVVGGGEVDGVLARHAGAGEGPVPAAGGVGAAAGVVAVIAAEAHLPQAAFGVGSGATEGPVAGAAS